MIKLSVAVGGGEIPIYDFDRFDQLIYFIEKLKQDRPTVWLFGEDLSPLPTEEILITERLNVITKWIKNNMMFGDMNTEPIYKYFIHEYESYESAYAVALNIREDNPLCYDNIQNDQSPTFHSISDLNDYFDSRNN